jgi:hypothetical protein
MTASEALDVIVSKAHGQPGFEPQGLTQLLDPLDQQVWLVEAQGIFAFRRGLLDPAGPAAPTRPTLRGTLLAAVSIDGGAIIYADVAYD